MENEYEKKALNVLVGDLEHFAGANKACFTYFREFNELIREKIKRYKDRQIKESLPVELFESLSVSDIDDDYFSVKFIGRKYVVKYSYDAYSAYPGCVTCYLVLSFPSVEYRKLDSFVFTEHGHTDKTEFNNETPIVIASASPVLYILLCWLDSSLRKAG